MKQKERERKKTIKMRTDDDDVERWVTTTLASYVVNDLLQQNIIDWNETKFNTRSRLDKRELKGQRVFKKGLANHQDIHKDPFPLLLTGITIHPINTWLKVALKTNLILIEITKFHK